MGANLSQGVLQTVQVPLTLLAMLGIGEDMWPKQIVPEDNAVHDYIVVGAGTAGCVVTRRLVEDGHSVLLLEAGGNPPVSALLPALFPSLAGSAYDYNYTSTRDEYAAKGQNNITMLTAGKMLGGSASLNHFIHTRGTAYDYDCWAEICEDDTWNFENVLPYFIKSERVVDEELIREYGEYHGTDGPMGLSRQPEDDQVKDLLKSFAEVGNPTLLDLNADKFVGYIQPQYMLAAGKRQTPGYNYLFDIKDDPNLYVSKNTRVTRVLFEGYVAVGVEAIYKNKTYTFRARKEVILCAGVFNTPQILMLSGIGPRKHLQSMNIPVLKNLPVGQNFVDQVAVHLVYKLEKHLLPNLGAVEIVPTKIPFPVIVGAVALNKSQPCPDYQTFGLKLGQEIPLLPTACSVVFGLRDEICNRWQKEVILRDSLYIVLVHLQPKSRGYVLLNSTDPFDKPKIRTGYFTAKKDIQDMIKFIRDFTSVGKTAYFQKINAELAGLDLPECTDKEKDSDEFWRCYILNHAGSPYHYTSTCAMRKVVDCELKVLGFEKLRIADASVMPKIPRGAPNAAVVMVAEKAADLIKSANY